MYKVLDLFSGIGGFSLGLERTGGFKTVAFCEIEEFPRKVLNKHWPGVPIYEDIRELTAERLLSDGIRPDVITGGFPCQDISVAGKQGGITADRSGLWTELARLISEIRPKYAIVENVTALLSGDNGRWFQRVLGDLAEIGYDTEWHCIPASELGANHHRDRVWIICYPNGSGFCEQGNECKQPRRAETIRASEAISRHSATRNTRPENRSKNVGDPSKLQRNGLNDHRENSKCDVSESGNTGSKGNVSNTINDGSYREEGNAPKPRFNWKKNGLLIRNDNWATEPDLGRVANGIPNRVHRLKGLGNAVVPQIPELFGRAILEAEHGGMCNG